MPETKPAPRVYADFNNADARGRLRLNCVGTIKDLARQQVELREGLSLALYSDDGDDHGRADELRADGVVTYSAEEQCWVAAIRWDAVRHASDDTADETPVARPPATGQPDQAA